MKDMKLPSLSIFFSAALVLASSPPSDWKNTIGNYCENKVELRSSFQTEEGEECFTCSFCNGQQLPSLFDPKVKNFCVDCTTADNECNTLNVLTSFEKPWPMKYINLMPSDASSDTDPVKVTLFASNDNNSWTEIFSSDSVTGSFFSSRNKNAIYAFENDVEYKYYSVKFLRINNNSKMKLGPYGIIQVYTKHCASSIFYDTTGINVLPYPTSSPTSSPTSNPTSSPTLAIADRYIGCYKDTHSPRDLPYKQPDSDTNTCLQVCKQKGYKYMGRQYINQCFCGNTYGSHGETSGCTNCMSQNANYGSNNNCIFSV